MRATLTFILLTALRDRLFPALAVLLVTVGALALFSGGATIAEHLDTAVVLAAGGMRAVLVFGVMVFVTFHVQRLVDTRELESLLSRPISRERLVLALFLGYGTVATLLVAGVAAVMLVAAPQTAGAALFGLSLGLEVLTVTGLALLAALTLERAVVSTLAVAALYVFSRLGAAFLAIAQSGRGLGGEAQTVLDWVLTAAALVVPRLDLFSQTRWLVHGIDADSLWPLMLLQAVIYLPLLLAAAMFDLRRKRV